MRAVKDSLAVPLRAKWENRKALAPGLMARPGKSIAKQSEGRAGEKYLPVGGRVRKLRAVGDQSAPIPEEITSELGVIIICSTRAVGGQAGLLL